MSTANNSHDLKTDHRSGYVLVFLVALIAFCTLGACGAFDKPDSPLVKVMSADGCDLYEFTRHGDVGYMARCPQTGVVATTDARGNVVVTIP